MLKVWKYLHLFFIITTATTKITAAPANETSIISGIPIDDDPVVLLVVFVLVVELVVIDVLLVLVETSVLRKCISVPELEECNSYKAPSAFQKVIVEVTSPSVVSAPQSSSVSTIWGPSVNPSSH